MDALCSWQAEMAKTFATKADLQLTEERLRSEMTELRSEVNDLRLSVRADMADLQASLIKWMVGLMLAGSALAATIGFGLARLLT